MSTEDPAADQAPDLIWGSQIGTYEWRPDSGRLLWSPELIRLYGLPRHPASEQDFLDRVHPDDRVRVEAETSAILGSSENSYSHVFRIVRVDGAVRIILDRGAIERDIAGRITVVRGVNIDVTEETHLNYTVEQRVRTDAGRYRKLFDAIDQGFCIVEVRYDIPDGRIDYRVVEANPAFYAKTGFPPDILGAWLRSAAPDLEEHWFETYGRIAKTGEPNRFENHSLMLGRWFDVFAFPADELGDQRVAILFQDITDRKNQDEQARLLVQEISHRSKNTMGIVQAIARLTAAAGTDGFLDRFSARVRALSASNDLLVRNSWKAVFLGELLDGQLSPFVDRSTQRVKLSGPRISLNDVATKALGMAFHELATNSAKYGALSNETGHISVTWEVEETDGSPSHVNVSWLERGGPVVTPPSRKGFGTVVTTQMVQSDTGGTVTVDYAPEGLSWRICCPAEKVLG
jgi:PAS domain S-box-containing protein